MNTECCGDLGSVEHADRRIYEGYVCSRCWVAVDENGKLIQPDEDQEKICS